MFIVYLVCQQNQTQPERGQSESTDTLIFWELTKMEARLEVEDFSEFLMSVHSLWLMQTENLLRDIQPNLDSEIARPLKLGSVLWEFQRYV